MQEWMPLVMQGRKADEKLAATRMSIGTDVNFGALSRGIFEKLKTMPGISLHTNHEVRKFKKLT